MNETLESAIAIRKKLFSLRLAFLIAGAFLLGLGFMASGANWNLVLGIVVLAFGMAELIVWHFRPTLLVAPWGISHRRHSLGNMVQYSHENVSGWSESSFEVVLRLADGKAIKIPLEDFRESEAERLTRALRECGYEYVSAAYDGA